MAKSIMQVGRYCYICKKDYNLYTTTNLEEHHVFGGPLRPLSEHYGLKVYLCHRHHTEPPTGVHFDATARWRLERDAKRAFDQRHGAGMLEKLIKKVQEEAPHAV